MDIQNDLSIFEEQVRLHSRDATIGSIVQIYEHDSIDDGSNHEASVILRDGEKEPRRMPILARRNGEAIVPQEGDFAFVEFLDGATNAPVVTHIIHNDVDRAPLARAGHWRQEFGPDRTESLYIEAERSDHSAGDPDVVRIAKKADGLSDPSTSIELDDSGAEPVIRLKTDGKVSIEGAGDVAINVAGDVTLSAGGNIVIDEGGTAKRVATEDHAHTTTLSDGTTATTSKPDDVTSAQIE